MTLKKQLPKVLLILFIFFSGLTVGYFYSQKRRASTPVKQTLKDSYLAFLNEVYTKIEENYWEKIEEDQLVNLFILGTEKLTGQPQVLKANTYDNLQAKLSEIFKQIETEEKKKEFTAKLADIVLANLQPVGRSHLYTEKEEKELSDNVKNINPDIDQYGVLGLDKEASQEAVEKAYQEKEKTASVEQAYKVLGDPETRQVYDVSGVEPTMDYQLIRPEIFYLHLKKFSPTTYDELKRVTEKVDDQERLDTLILDLRDNIGGSIDLLPYFLGPFIGQDQYAYQFYHQGEKEDFKTRTGWLASLVRYKKVLILINENTQSSTEVMAATLKKYNVGVTLGTTTKGWGTVEKVFPMEQQIDPSEKYSIFMVHSVTLRDDGQPIQGRGVDPLINIEDSNWEQQLLSYFHYPELIEAVKEVL
jgi:C-terminal processing protease CtpA/Prc